MKLRLAGFAGTAMDHTNNLIAKPVLFVRARLPGLAPILSLGAR